MTFHGHTAQVKGRAGGVTEYPQLNGIRKQQITQRHYVGTLVFIAGYISNNSVDLY
jgi:hypothetical protein